MMGNNMKVVTIIFILLTLPFTLLLTWFVSRRSKKKAEKKRRQLRRRKQAGLLRLRLQRARQHPSDNILALPRAPKKRCSS
jgi:preprotein translocase subunit SecG